MKYELLKKIYYQNSELYQKTYEERFSCASATHIDFTIRDFPAFFVLTPDNTKDLVDIMQLDKLIHQVCSKLPNVALDQYTRTCLIDEITLTNNIEGVHSTRKEIDQVLDSLESSEDKRRFQGLVQKYVMLINKEDVRLKTCQDIRNIYDELFLDEIQEDDPDNVPDGSIFRKGPVSVYSSTGKEVHRGLSPESEIIESMEKALDVLNNNDIVPLFRIAIFHYLFGYIHPFYDGNGRTSRFISSYLMSTCFESLVSYRLSYVIKQRLSEYSKCFQICNDPLNKGDMTPFIAMFLSVVKDSMQQLYEVLVEKQQQRISYNTKASNIEGACDKDRAQIYNLLIQAALFSEKGISTQDLIRMVEVSRTTLTNKMKDIKDKGLVKTQRFGKEKYFMIDLDALDSLSAGS